MFCALLFIGWYGICFLGFTLFSSFTAVGSSSHVSKVLFTSNSRRWRVVSPKSAEGQSLDRTLLGAIRFARRCLLSWIVKHPSVVPEPAAKLLSLACSNRLKLGGGTNTSTCSLPIVPNPTRQLGLILGTRYLINNSLCCVMKR